MSEDQILDAATGAMRRSGVSGEVYLERSTATIIVVHEEKIESLVQRGARGAGLRVFENGRTAFQFTADLSPEGLARAIETARAIAPHTKQDEANALTAITPSVPSLVNHDVAVGETPVTVKMEIARAVERAARAESPRIEKTRESSYQDFQSRIWIASTDGGLATHEASRCYAGIDLAATEGGASQTGNCVGWALGPNGLDPASVGREAARRGLRKLGATQPRTARTAVVLDPEATAGLFGALAGLFSAEAVLKNRSLFAGKLGQVVASSAVTLVDDGGIAGGFSSAPVDGEGTPTGETVLISQGTLRAYFHSAFTARKMGLAPTGNGVRGGYTSAPEPSPTNLYLRPTGITREALLASVPSGIYVTEWMGLHTVNTTTGDFSLGASGVTIEGGRLGGGVDRMAISGNIASLLGSVEAVATDLAFLVQGGGATVLLRDISISGAGS
jgi:PmbA protein